MTESELENLTSGDLLICNEHINSLYLKQNDVITFSNYHKETHFYIQIKELFDYGLSEHNQPYNQFEIFDKSKHTDFLIVSNDTMNNNKNSNPFF